MLNPKDIDVVILCGGMGRRLKGIISDRPKPMAEIKGQPFLDILIDYIAQYDFARFILCTGYKGFFIRRYYKNKSKGLAILISEEKEPLGTAGAIKNAESFIRNDTFLGLNGDSICQLNLLDLLSFHKDKKATVSIALAAVEGTADYGVVRLDEDQRIVSFNEKTPTEGTRLINAGVYAFERAILGQIPEAKKLSLEYDIFPRLLDKKIYGFITKERLFDIGTPERLELTKKLLK